MKQLRRNVVAVTIITTILGSTAFAYSDAERIQDMQAMESAVQQMQKGFLYNNLKDIAEGAKVLKEHTAKIEPPIDKNADSFKRNYAYDVTKREARKIINLADSAVKKYKEHRPKQAINDFTKILKQCMTCHARIRKW